MPAVLDTVWAIPAETRFLWRFWDDRYIVFSCGSGDTHSLERFDGEVLRMIEAEPADGRELMARVAELFELERDDDLAHHMELLLTQLETLGLIESTLK